MSSTADLDDVNKPLNLAGSRLVIHCLLFRSLSYVVTKAGYPKRQTPSCQGFIINNIQTVESSRVESQKPWHVKSLVAAMFNFRRSGLSDPA